MSEQYVRERKSNAQKQFAYNKLKNEKQITLKQEQSKSNTAPKRPPQPKHINVDKKEKEGMLIDLTSPQQHNADDTASALAPNGFDCGIGDNGFMPKVLNGMSLMDTPIEVPTQGYQDDEPQSTVDYFTNDSNKLEPPPYQSPPTYMNTYGISKSTSKYASALSMGVSGSTATTAATTTNQYGNLDPFDTSHISTASSSQCNNASRYDSSFIQNAIQKTNYMDLPSAMPPPPPPTINRPNASNAAAELDEMVQNKMASFSPKRSQTPTVHGERTANSMASMMANDTKSSNLNQSIDELSFKMGANSTLSDSLKVNLSSLTLNDTDEFENSRPSSSLTAERPNPKLDRAFLAELEKEMYKCDESNVNVKNANAKIDNSYAMACASTLAGAAATATAASASTGKDATVNDISSSFNWFKNDFSNSGGSGGGSGDNATNRSIPITQSPAKIYNNEQTMVKLTNYDSTAANMTLSKKLYNTNVSNVEPNGYGMSSVSAMQNDISTYSNYGPTVPTNSTQPTTTAYAKTLNTNSAYAMASDIYGSMAGGGNVYDIVASSGNSDYYQIIQPNESQTVIYDEVAADDNLMRPHRPAPVPPSGAPVLSAQQIQRRIERAQKGQSQLQQQQLYDNLNSTYANGTRNSYIYEEIVQKNSNSESKETINAASSETMKNMKIDHLLR